MKRINKQRKVCFEEWGIYENEEWMRPFLKYFAKVIDDNLNDNPPQILLDWKNGKDIEGKLYIAGLESYDSTPTFKFSLKDEFDLSGIDPEERESLSKTLRKLADYVDGWKE